MATITPANPSSPQAVVHYYVDGAGNVQQVSVATPFPIYTGTSTATVALTGTGTVSPAASYSIISTAGTTTAKATPGIYYGASVVTAGAASTFSVLDGATAIVGTATNQSAGLVTSPFPAGIGVKFNTSLVIVTAGTGVSTTAFLFA